MLTEHVRRAGFGDVRARTAGDTDHHGARQPAHRLQMAALRLIGQRHRADEGEGICVFVTATAG
ncbi:hypothetical protein [Goekera deserti]|uniref:hypothetical protein n=1 Tax=Goekera deserti TaxID=2497753 RepID=UPI001F253246|nr:hypothetical protein [Goekera deserti]